MVSVKVCSRCGKPRGAAYCRSCKAANERARYERNAAQERHRKRVEYAQKVGKPVPSLLRTPEPYVIQRGAPMVKDCEHDLARQTDEYPGLFCCFDCGSWLNMDGEAVADPTEEASSTPPKARPAKRGGESQRTYQRDPSLMVTVKCSQPGCKNTWPAWPQNVPPRPLCPAVHRPLLKAAQNKKRQKAYRRNKAEQG